MDSAILPRVTPELCDGCGQCISACPTGALALRGGIVTLVAPEHCAYDGKCEIACPTGAIEVPFLVTFRENVG